MEQNNLIAFQDKQIRQVEHEGQTYFSAIDVIEALTESPSPSHYWSMLKKREPQLVTVCYRLKLEATDGKQRQTDCAHTEGVLRIIQSVPSPKAEPFKMWLASLGKQAIEEASDPELLTERQAEIYRAKGYSEDWITRRVESIEARKRLTAEWKERGVTEGQEYAILTAEIAKATFGVTPKEHSALKSLTKPSQNLRDHMTPFELIFTALGEEASRAVAIRNDAQGFGENHEAAADGGRMAGNARRNFEKDFGEKVVSPTNYLNLLAEQNEVKELPESK